MKEKLASIKQAALAALASPEADVEELRIRFLGKKGELTAVLRGMGALSAEERPVIGQLANEVRAEIEQAISARMAEQKAAAAEARLKAERLDVTMPGKASPVGHIHPLTRVQRELEDIFIGMGFRIVEDFQTYADLHPTPKMLIVDWSAQVQARMAQLAQDFPMLDFCQSESYLIEVIPKGAGKGKALAQLAELMGVRQDEVMALGDNTNDLPMLRWAGLGVVVSNGVPSVKAEADYVCQAERSEGVEEALRKFVL